METLRPVANGRKFIYDHQKAGTDIPDLEDALPDLVETGVEGVIFFPFAGAETLERWTKAAQAAGLSVIVGGMMTQKRFLWSEGGFVHDEAPERIYRMAVDLGVRQFVVPGNKPEMVLKYRGVVEDQVSRQAERGEDIVLMAPGFIDQGGKISEAGQVAGERFHTIAGRAVVNAEDPRAASLSLMVEIREL
jgi:orotidine-5'-phosphate decarboxylase